jgi:hypothetical protein
MSIPFIISTAVVAALEADTELAGMTVVDNPITPSALDDGARVVFVEDKDDAPLDKPGQAEGRTFGFIVGVINRTAGARAGADADMERVKAVATLAARNACRDLLQGKQIVKFDYPREMQRAYRVEGIDVGGALITTRFEIDYRLPSSARAAT